MEQKIRIAVYFAVLIGLGFMSKVIITGQTRSFNKEIKVKIINKEIIMERVTKKLMNIPYFTVLDEQGEEIKFKTSDYVYSNYQINDICLLVLEKDFWGTKWYEIKEDYDKRQGRINTSTNKFLGVLVISGLVLAWFYFIRKIINEIKILKNSN
jgi:hypothetical protein